jgi:hypothetical protein
MIYRDYICCDLSALNFLDAIFIFFLLVAQIYLCSVGGLPFNYHIVPHGSDLILF